MRVLTSEGECFSLYFDKTDEDNINDVTLKEILIHNQTTQAKRGKVFGYSPVKHTFGFCNIFENVAKNISSHVTLKTVDLQDIVHTTLPQATVIFVSSENLHLFIPTFIPSPDTQILFNGV